MKQLFISLVLLFLTLSRSYAQSPVYYFSASTDTAIESNAYVIAGYVKTDTAPMIPDSVIIILRSGSPRTTHMDTTSRYVVAFSPGQDSVALILHITKDTFPEYPEHVLYILTGSTNGSSIGVDSALLFVLIDTTPPATIGYIIDSAWAWEDIDTFINGVHYTASNPAYGIGIMVNNPNPFYVRYGADNYNLWYNPHGYPFINSYAGTDFYFNGETCYAPPGVSVYHKIANIVVGDNNTYDKYFLCTLSNFDANLIIDTFVFFTIKPVDFYIPPSISFDTPAMTFVIGDTNLTIGIPVTIINSNRRPLYYNIDTIQTTSSFPGMNFLIGNQNFGFGNGTTHDTLWLQLLNRNVLGDTIRATFVIRPTTFNTIGNTLNTSTDSLLNLTIIDTGTLQVSFLGAGLSHLKSDSIGYVKVYTSSFAKFPISVDVSYLTGNAIRDTDFIFTDTTITFSAFTFDTISLPVVMLQDHRNQGNTQVVLQLTNVNPSTVQYGITQYTYIIIDNVDSGLPPLGLRQMDNGQNIRVYPNPFDNEINIQTTLPEYTVSITNSLGQMVYDFNDQKGNIAIDFADQPSGLYLIRLSYGDKVYTTKVLKL